MEILYSNNLPKVIHTWSSDAPIWKEEAYVQMASALSVLKYYGYVHFYGDENSIKEVSKLKIPYSTIELIEKRQFDTTFAVPKIQVYSKFDNTRDFIHLDTDTVLFRKLDFSKFRSPFVFSHCDKYMDTLDLSYRESINQYFRATVEPAPEEKFHNQLHNTYLKPFLLFNDKLPQHIVKATDVGSIPNMNVVYVKKGNGEIFAKASQFVLDFYSRNKQLVDQQDNGSCFIEQFLLHQHLRTSHSTYLEESNKLEHVLKHRNPLNQLGTPGLRTTTNQTSYPVKFTYQKPRCSECGTLGSVGEFELSSKQDIRKLFDMDFGESLHFTHMVWYEWWQCYIINHIVRNYGVEYVKRVHNHYNKDFNNPKLSGGEKLYEEITGNKIFSK